MTKQAVRWLVLSLVAATFAHGFKNISPSRTITHHPRPSQKCIALYSSSSTIPASDSTDDATVLRSITFCYVPRDQEPDLLCEYLLELGACSASITDADRGTDREQPMFREFLTTTTTTTTSRQEEEEEEEDSQLQWDDQPVWKRCNVTAHFPASVNVPSVVQVVRETFEDGEGVAFLKRGYKVEQVPNKDWVVHVQQGWAPIMVGDRFILRFPWHTDADVERARHEKKKNSGPEEEKNPSPIELQLQGGIAFGTGEHPTTQLCLEWLDEVVSKYLLLSDEASPSDDLIILDYGAGSGLLGIAACALAPTRVRAVGVDIDVDACRIANANAVQNNVRMQTYMPPLVAETTADDESKSLLLKAHAHVQKQLAERGENWGEDLVALPSYGEVIHVCVANILAGPLVALAPTLCSKMRPGGLLGMSGILPHQDDMVVQAYRQAGFKEVQVARQLDGWILVTGKRPSE